MREGRELDAFNHVRAATGITASGLLVLALRLA
jgi:uncharacterized membrane protein